MNRFPLIVASVVLTLGIGACSGTEGNLQPPQSDSSAPSTELPTAGAPAPQTNEPAWLTEDREQAAGVSAAMRPVHLPADFVADGSWFWGSCNYFDYFGCWTSPNDPGVVAGELADATKASGIATQDVTYNSEKRQIAVRVDSGVALFDIYSAPPGKGSYILGAVSFGADTVGAESASPGDES